MIRFIINPAANNGKSQKIMSQAVVLLKERYGVPYQILATTGPYTAAGLVRVCGGAGAETIVAVGGDGTILEVASGILDYQKENPGRRIKLGILPAGSGNDLIRSLGLKKNTAAALEAILAGNTIAVDALTVNGTYALNIVCMGIDAEIVRWREKIKGYTGRFSYGISVMKNIFTYRCMPAVIEADGQRLEGAFTLIAAANGRYYGGGFHIAPMASLSDGRITLCCVAAMPWYRVLLIFPAILVGLHTRLKAVRYMNCKEIKITYGKAYSLNADGNIFTAWDQAEIGILPGALDIIIE